MLIDTHCHLYFPQFAEDLPVVLTRMTAAGVQRAIVIGIDTATNSQAQALAGAHPALHYAAGLHPTSEFPVEVLAGADFDAATYLSPWLAGDPAPVALGECGIDLHWDTNPLELQHAVFTAQLRLARERDLPVVVHSRDAEAETLAALISVPGTRGVLHCFAGGPALLAWALDQPEWYISFAGNVTFPKAHELHQAARDTPLSRLLLETDAPFLAPQPRRGRRAEPADVAHTAQGVAELRGMSVAELAAATTANAYRLFRLPALQSA